MQTLTPIVSPNQNLINSMKFRILLGSNIYFVWGFSCLWTEPNYKFIYVPITYLVTALIGMVLHYKIHRAIALFHTIGSVLLFSFNIVNIVVWFIISPILFFANLIVGVVILILLLVLCVYMTLCSFKLLKSLSIDSLSEQMMYQNQVAYQNQDPGIVMQAFPEG